MVGSPTSARHSAAKNSNTAASGTFECGADVDSCSSNAICTNANSATPYNRDAITRTFPNTLTRYAIADSKHNIVVDPSTTTDSNVSTGINLFSFADIVSNPNHDTDSASERAAHTETRTGIAYSHLLIQSNRS